ncbi:MAG: c-type cytochrome [Chloroflexi bacterium]|nr:c-type cytochrome [Chloroflexota bacterium]
MRLRNNIWLPFTFVMLGFALVFASGVQAQDEPPTEEDIIQGAVLYDNWFAALGLDAPTGEMPIWARQSTNTRSGPETWRCVECHGWDYRGALGAYGSGSHYTGFPDVMSLAAEMSEADILAHLNGENDPAHDFSPYLDETSMRQLAAFLKYGVIDDSLYIDVVSLKVIGGDVDHGQSLYENVCAECHGTDGMQIVFRTEGVDEYLGTVAFRDPWRFLHRTRFGTAGTEMPVGAALGWSPADGRDVLAYAQTFPTGQEESTPAPAVEQAEPAQQVGGPAVNWWTGFLTSLGAFLGAIGYALVFIGGFVLIGFIVVMILRRRK